MAHLGRRAAARRRNNIVWGIVAFVAFFGAVAALIYAQREAPAKLNPDTLCPPGGPQGHIVLLVDRTDPLNFTQKKAFSELMHEVIERRTPAGHLLSVYVLGEDFKETAEPLIEMCNPGTGEGTSTLTGNPQKERRRYEQRFLKPLNEQAESLVSSTAAKYSPIFEMLQMVSINSFRKHGVQGERRLLIVSDMLHNTPQASMFRGPLDYGTFAQSEYGHKMSLEMQGVKVELNYLLHNPKLQTMKNVNFWEKHFDKAGARVVEVRRIEG